MWVLRVLWVLGSVLFAAIGLGFLALPTPQEGAADWARQLKSNTDKIRRGVERVRESPGEAANRSLEKMRVNWNEALNNGTIERGNRSYTVDEWRRLTSTKGLSNLPAGVDAAVGKMERFNTEFYPHLEAGMVQVKSMPNVSLEDGVNRATFMIRHNAEFRRRA